ncbi:MAG: hypothetical protein WBB28_20105 [Crinalium sp.]
MAKTLLEIEQQETGNNLNLPVIPNQFEYPLHLNFLVRAGLTKISVNT